jgi:hypothetical protein
MSWSWTPSDVEPIHVYHSKLWEDKATDFIYEIFNWVMVSMHVTIFGNPPPRISDSIVANLSSVADWYVEAEFSYIRVFVPLFLHILYHYLYQIGWFVAKSLGKP